MLIYEAFLLIRHDIGRKDSLLSLLTFLLKGCQGAQLLVHTPIRRRILACTNTRVLITVVIHTGIHRIITNCLFGNLWAVITVWHRFRISRRLQIVLVDWTKQAFLELDALCNIGPDCLLLVKDSDCAGWASRIHET